MTEKIVLVPGDGIGKEISEKCGSSICHTDTCYCMDAS